MANSSDNILANGYSIFQGSDALSDFSQFVDNAGKVYSSIHLLLDENVEQLCLPVLFDKAPSLNNCSLIRTPSGEINKNINTVVDIWKRLMEGGANRNSLLINLGGGVITDMGGFAASTFKRGIDFVNIPTTLLGQVDASIGGKTGIDLLEIKNQVGLIKSPVAVFVIPEFLKTLDHQQLKSGYAEILKYGLISDKRLWELAIDKYAALSNYQESTWNDLINRSLVIKNEIVLNDPEEQGLRRVLNFGHTIGHAVEAHSLKNDKVPLSHGEAVAIGMICEAYISSKVLNLNSEERDEIAKTILSIFEKYDLSKAQDTELLELMKHDKKNQHGRKNFTLLKNIGEAVIDQQCDDVLIVEALDYYRNYGKS